MNPTFFLLLLLQYFHATDKTLLWVHEVWASIIFIHVCLKGSVIIWHADCFVVMNFNEEALYFLLRNLLNTLSFSQGGTVHCHCHE